MSAANSMWCRVQTDSLCVMHGKVHLTMSHLYKMPYFAVAVVVERRCGRVSGLECARM